MIKRIIAGVMIGLMSAMMCITAFAGEWAQDSHGWRYVYGDEGGYNTGWITDWEGKQYYLGDDGYLITNTTTPDGYTVDASGAWYQAVPEVCTESDWLGMYACGGKQYTECVIYAGANGLIYEEIDHTADGRDPSEMLEMTFTDSSKRTAKVHSSVYGDVTLTINNYGIQFHSQNIDDMLYRHKGGQIVGWWETAPEADGGSYEYQIAYIALRTYNIMRIRVEPDGFARGTGIVEISRWDLDDGDLSLEGNQLSGDDFFTKIEFSNGFKTMTVYDNNGTHVAHKQ